MWLFMQAFADGLGVSLNSKYMYKFFYGNKGIGRGMLLVTMDSFAPKSVNHVCRYDA